MSKLYIVSTPIGNLEDITYRAVKILKSVSLILCEDTRRTKILCEHYGITTPLKSYYSYIEHRRIKEVLPYIKQGNEVALVSDSGTPGISDPGYLIIKECIEEGIPVVPLPGPTAFVSAAVCSGLPLDKILFLGFLPKKQNHVVKLFQQIKSIENLTIVFFESPLRVKKTLELLLSMFHQQTKCVLVRELTKVYEEFIRGSLKEVFDKIKDRNLKGEIVIVLNTGEIDEES